MVSYVALLVVCSCALVTASLPTSHITSSHGSQASRRACRHESRTRVLITGVSGMIGSHVARHLVTDPCVDVHGLIRWRSDLSSLNGILHKIKMVYGDITDSVTMRDVLRSTRPDYIYHFAAQAINSVSYASPELTTQVNVMGTLNLLEAMHALNMTSTRFLLAGSSTEDGKTCDTGPGPVPETAPMEPVSPYGASKVASEMLARQYHNAFGLDVIIARFFIQVGAGGTETLAIHEFCKQIAMIERGLQKPILTHGNIDSLRDMTDARDSAAVVVRLAKDGASGEAYNIGSGNAMSIRDLLETAVGLSDMSAKIELRSDASKFRPYDEKILLADITKIKNLTGWVPKTDMKDTVLSILHYWRLKVQAMYSAATAL